jgi:hypothetical protein
VKQPVEKGLLGERPLALPCFVSLLGKQTGFPKSWQTRDEFPGENPFPGKRLIGGASRACLAGARPEKAHSRPGRLFLTMVSD